MTQRTTQSNGNDINKLSLELAVMSNQVTNIETNVKEIKTKMEAEYVTKDQFTPVKNIVYGLVSLILVAVVGAIVTLVIKQ